MVISAKGDQLNLDDVPPDVKKASVLANATSSGGLCPPALNEVPASLRGKVYNPRGSGDSTRYFFARASREEVVELEEFLHNSDRDDTARIDALRGLGKRDPKPQSARTFFAELRKGCKAKHAALNEGKDLDASVGGSESDERNPQEAAKIDALNRLNRLISILREESESFAESYWREYQKMPEGVTPEERRQRLFNASRLRIDHGAECTRITASLQVAFPFFSSGAWSELVEQTMGRYARFQEAVHQQACRVEGPVGAIEPVFSLLHSTIKPLADQRDRLRDTSLVSPSSAH